MLSSNGFLPLITRPTRVIATSATLIDDIFTNNLIDISSSFQGLLVFFHPNIKMIFTMLLVWLTGMKFTGLQTSSAPMIYFMTICWNCTTNTSQKLGQKRNTIIESLGYLKHWKSQLDTKTNCTWNTRKWDLPSMKTIIKNIRADCNIWLKWLKSNIFMTWLLDTGIMLKSLGRS